MTWQARAEKILSHILRSGECLPGIRRAKLQDPVKIPRFPWSASVQLVSSEKMRRLNRQYRRKNKPTDVLSFQAPAIFRAQGNLGELVICLPVLKKQAKALNHSPEAELEVLLVHGVLHLLGLDHEKSKSAAAAMAQWESRLLKKAHAGLIARSR